MATESSRPSRKYGPGVDDERGLREQVPVAQQPPHRRGQHVERAGQVEVERRIEEELRVQVAARGGEGLGHHHALVGVDEAVRQAPGDALEAQRQREDEDGERAGRRRGRRGAGGRRSCRSPAGGGRRGRAAVGLVAEAAHGAGVAGRAGGLDGEQHRVVVAVQPHGHARAARCRWCRPCARARAGCGSRSAPRRCAAWRAGPLRWRRRP